jgi:hypothetical protein
MVAWKEAGHAVAAKLTHFFVAEIACLGHGKRIELIERRL